MWRRWCLVPVVLLVAGCDPQAVHISGTFVAAAVTGDSPAATAIWTESKRPAPVPWTDVVVADVQWRTEGPADGCSVNLLVLHDEGWQVSTVTDPAVQTATSGPFLQAVAATHPEIMRQPDGDPNAAPVLAGTSLITDPATHPTAVKVMWQIPGRALADIRIGAAVFCDDRLEDFQWLNRQG